MNNFELESLLSSEMEDVKGGACAQDTCVCENGGAGAVVIYNGGPDPDGGNTYEPGMGIYHVWQIVK